MSNIDDKINEIFGDEFNDNKRLVLSPKRHITSKFKKNINDDNLNINIKEDKLSEKQNNKTNSSKIKKKYKKTKDIKGSIGIEEMLNLNKEINVINNNYNKKEKKEEKESKQMDKIEKGKKEKKEENQKEKKDLINNPINDLDLDDYPIPKRGRGQSHHVKNKVESLNVFKGILRRNSKKGKKSKFDLEKEDQKKVEEKEENEENEEKEEKKIKKDGDEEENKNKKKEKKKNLSPNKSRNKINSKSIIMEEKSKYKNKMSNTLYRISGSIIESNIEIINEKKEAVNNSLFHTKMGTPKSKIKKKKKVLKLSKSIKDINSNEKMTNEKMNIFFSQKKEEIPYRKPNLLNKNSCCSSSKLSSSINSKISNIKKKKDKNIDIKKDKNDDKDSHFQSSKFSSDLEEDMNISKKIGHNFKSEKNIELFVKYKSTENGKNEINEKSKKFSYKKEVVRDTGLGEEDNKKVLKDNDSSFYLEEEMKDSSKYIKDQKNTNIKPKPFNIDYNNKSQYKIKKLNSKKNLGGIAQLQISKKVNDVFIFPEKNRKLNLINNQNVISPQNYISIEYNVNHGNKIERNLQMNNNHIIINNNESNNINYFRRGKQIKNDNIEINQNTQKLNDDNSKNNELINSQDHNLFKYQKKPKKNFCLCCF